MTETPTSGGRTTTRWSGSCAGGRRVVDDQVYARLRAIMDPSSRRTHLVPRCQDYDGPWNCIGGAFAQLEVRLVLVRILQRADPAWMRGQIAPSMGATLEPHPHMKMRVESMA